MKLLRWILGLVVLGAVVALVIVFWPTIMQAGQRCLSRSGANESDELEELPSSVVAELLSDTAVSL